MASACFGQSVRAPMPLFLFRVIRCALSVVLTDAVSQTRQSATSKYEAEHVQWLKYQAELEAEVQKLRAKLNQDR